jgi:hypothetical protein
MTDRETRNLLLLAALLSVAPPAPAGQKPLTRLFTRDAEERYQVTVGLRAETHSVTTEAVAASTYVTPVVHVAEGTLRWRSVKRVLAIRADGSVDTEEAVTPLAERCEGPAQPAETSDARLQASLDAACSAILKTGVLRSVEDRRGLLRESAPSPRFGLGEAAPELLALWLRRAVRPSVIFPALPFEAGAKVERPLHPTGEWLKNARGSESTEWLEAREETPSASLHVVQHLSWEGASEDSPAGGAAFVPARQEEFFADSLTTVSLLDGSVLRASRSASRTTSHKMEPVPGLAGTPDFSSRLTVSVKMERLP